MDDAPVALVPRPCSKSKALVAFPRMSACVGVNEPVDRLVDHRLGVVWRLTEPSDQGASGLTAVPARRAADNALL